MAKKLPRKFFPGYTATITFSKVDRWAEMHAKTGIRPYFDTWEEAHSHMMLKAGEKLKRAERDLASAKRHFIKVSAMKKPEA